MKSALTFCLLLALMLAHAVGAQNATPGARLRKVSGQAYVRVADWAKVRGFTARWLKAGETLELNSPTSKVMLTVDSRQAQVNGVQVWLFFPAVAQDDAAWLTALDADLTLRPLVSTPRRQSGTQIKTVCLDPGHGGKDPGNQVGSNQEKRYTLLLAQEVRKQLARVGLKATLTRSADSFIELADRPELARRCKADLFISLHFNGTDGRRSTAQGVEVYCLTPAGVASTNARGEGSGAGSYAGNRHNALNLFLAYQVQKALTRNLAVEDRGVRRARFAVLRGAVMPAVLIEAGFMSHPEEGRKLLTAAYRQQVAKAIVAGLLAYKRVVERAT